MSALQTTRPPTYRWVLIVLAAVVAASAPLGWFLFWLVNG